MLAGNAFVIHRLEQSLNKPYSKGDGIFDEVFSETDKAAKRAHQFFKNKDEIRPAIPPTPYTDVHRLVGYLKEVANS